MRHALAFRPQIARLLPSLVTIIKNLRAALLRVFPCGSGCPSIALKTSFFSIRLIDKYQATCRTVNIIPAELKLSLCLTQQSPPRAPHAAGFCMHTSKVVASRMKLLRAVRIVTIAEPQRPHPVRTFGLTKRRARQLSSFFVSATGRFLRCKISRCYLQNHLSHITALNIWRQSLKNALKFTVASAIEIVANLRPNDACSRGLLAVASTEMRPSKLCR
jgi:hypothetical protein